MKLEIKMIVTTCTYLETDVSKLIFIISLCVMSVAAPQYKSYKQWKEDQVVYWQSRGRGEMAKELTMADYFAGYVTKQANQAEAIKEVSSRLSHPEVAELMTIYANSVFGTQAPSLPYRADNLGKELGKRP
jgi:hypothetical protein